mmetsp:Transcript_58666/g.154522  ORF Transcript_58666/g.154522 Transcript_58666/m.154522 type:complete len:257 (+) Transcript_58666:1930-2700(+)
MCPERHCFSVSHMPRRAKGSMPLDGSSRITRYGLERNASAQLSLRFMPPDRAEERVCILSISATAVSSSSPLFTSSPRAMPPILPKRSRCSKTVSSSTRTLCCGQKPMSLRTDRSCSGTMDPRTLIVPADWGRQPVSIIIVVVLPAPLWPRRQKHSSWYMVRERLFTAVMLLPAASLNVLWRPRMSTHLLFTTRLFRCSSSSDSMCWPVVTASSSLPVRPSMTGGSPMTSRQKEPMQRNQGLRATPTPCHVATLST